MELVVLRFSQEVPIANPKDSSNNFLILGVRGTKKEIRVSVSESTMREIVQLVFGQEEQLEPEETERGLSEDELVDVEQGEILEEDSNTPTHVLALAVDEDGVESL